MNVTRSTETTAKEAIKGKSINQNLHVLVKAKPNPIF